MVCVWYGVCGVRICAVQSTCGRRSRWTPWSTWRPWSRWRPAWSAGSACARPASWSSPASTPPASAGPRGDAALRRSCQASWESEPTTSAGVFVNRLSFRVQFWLQADHWYPKVCLELEDLVVERLANLDLSLGACFSLQCLENRVSEKWESSPNTAKFCTISGAHLTSTWKGCLT